MRFRSDRLLLLITFLLLPLLAGATAAQPVATDDAQRVASELESLRREVADLHRLYRERIDVLESRVAALEGTGPAPTEVPQPARAELVVPEGAAGVGGPQGTLPLYGNVSAMSKIFNPDIAVIGSFIGVAGKNPVESVPAFEMKEVETSLQAVVDPYARADFFLSVSPEGIEVEEGYVTFPTLPGGILLKAGKLRSAFGKMNTLHTHAVPFADRPLVTQNLLGGAEGISDAGISVARLISNPWVFLEATGEVYSGTSEVFQSTRRRDLSYVGHLRGYRDFTDSSNVELGGSFAFGHNDAGPSETTRILGFDGTFRYRPLRRSIYRGLLARTELVWSRRTEHGGPTAFGAYVGAEYQFSRRWFAGGRYDHAERARDPDVRDTGTSWLLTFWPSEYSQIRGQYRRTKYAEGETANELLLQLLFSIGAHGAHPF